MIVFTICSNNYLSEAIVLGDSLTSNGLNRDCFKIYLADKFSQEIDYSSIVYDIIEVESTVIPDFEKIKESYNIIEFNTAVKPSLFKALMNDFPNENLFSYLDPDIYVISDFEKCVTAEIEKNSILLTPHITEPLSINTLPFENDFLNYGIYNLGFLAVLRAEETFNFLHWWEQRTINMGVINVENGLFVDQLWINLVPIFFSKVKITYNLGLNVAFWNINQRKIEKKSKLYYVRNYELIFIHFSSLDFKNRRLTKKNHSTKENIVLKEIVEEYCNKLENANYLFYKTIPYHYKLTFKEYTKKVLPHESDFRINLMKFFLRIIPDFLVQKISNFSHVYFKIKEYNSK